MSPKQFLIVSLSILFVAAGLTAAEPQAEQSSAATVSKPTGPGAGKLSALKSETLSEETKASLLSAKPLLRSGPMELAVPEDVGIEAVGQSPRARGPRPDDAGDIIQIGTNDGLGEGKADLTDVPEHEAVIEVVDSAGTYYVAYRQPTVEYVNEFPVSVTGLSVLLDNVFGFYDWTAHLVAEDPADPLKPGPIAGALATVTLAGTSQPAPDGDPTKPEYDGDSDDWSRFTEDIGPITWNSDLSVTDRTWNDDFTSWSHWDKAVLPRDLAYDDGLVDTLWVECNVEARVFPCKAPTDAKAFVVDCPDPGVCDAGAGNNMIYKRAAEGALALKSSPIASIDDGTEVTPIYNIRPMFDDDLKLYVEYDVSAVTANEAGLFLRAARQLYAGDGFYLYYAAYQKSTGNVILVEAQPGATEDDPPTYVEVASTNVGDVPTGTLELEVIGATPTSHFKVYHNGTEVISYDDSTYNWYTTFPWMGVASLDAASTGETWTNFLVYRNPDLYVVLEAPAGAAPGAGVGAELSHSMRQYFDILRSPDYTTWELAFTPDEDCKWPNGWARLRVEDTTADGIHNLFQREFRRPNVRMECLTCDPGTNACEDNVAPSQATPGIFGTGEEVGVYGNWWNDHAPNLIGGPPPEGGFGSADWAIVWEYPFIPDVTPQTFTGPCSRFQVTAWVTGIILPAPIDLTGQNEGGPGFYRWTSGGAEYPMASFTPATPGTYCIEVIAGYDMNEDYAPDGFQDGNFFLRSPDDKMSTGVVHRFVNVEDNCNPTPTSTLARNCMRVCKEGVFSPASGLGCNYPDAISPTGNVCAHWVDQDPADIFDYTMTSRWDRMPAGVPPSPISDACYLNYDDTVATLPPEAECPAMDFDPACAVGSEPCITYFAVYQDEGCGARDCSMVPGEAEPLADTGDLSCPF